MSIEYLKARNESLTCTYNGLYLHSSYNPENESQRFVQSLKIDYTPESIVVIEPALAYCAKDLRARFPEVKLYAIRFAKEFNAASASYAASASCATFEKEFLFDSPNALSLELFNTLGEEGLLNSFFVSWPPSAKAFAQKDAECWNVISSVVKNAQSILATRQYFAKRWIKNQFNFFNSIYKTALLNKIDMPVLICASGPSLKTSIPFIKKMQEQFFIIACSSSLKPLLYNKIKPDLCISTDGGYWAKKHLECLMQNTDIPLCIPSESCVSKKILRKNTIIPLAYGDNADNLIFEKFSIPYLYAKRNGTISGTAVELAQSITDKNIFFCGLDMESTKGFVHTQPNELENINSLIDTKLTPREKRIFIQGRDSSQLEIYRNWFIENSERLSKRLYRLSDGWNYCNKLGFIKDINWSEITNYIECKNFSAEEKKKYFTNASITECGKSEVKKIFLDLLNNAEWQKNYFPADFIAVKRKFGPDKICAEKNLNSKIEDIKKYIASQET
ncbi:6-hydroxymethylpterin diphosphokinase MptE-like protein [Treponema sp.]|uniref:6-hydroxymethylpterin diphosphokinase MptE-like protein n=1 Tax=Treponema sp. TaxID=166 RepID=UPI00298DA789|nr:6-hydroxymethylpterin diphosphokinase MptE-like protein [Treponema sp.]MCR5612470.1 DUF115 domain-containing protein [Treponema sp.]